MHGSTCQSMDGPTRNRDSDDEAASQFSCLANELYLCVFAYLNPVDVLYSFSDINHRLNLSLAIYFRSPWKHLDLRRVHTHVFDSYSSSRLVNNEIDSVRLTGEQFRSAPSLVARHVRHVRLALDSDLHLANGQFELLSSLERLVVEFYALTWSKSIECDRLRVVRIHLRSHDDLLGCLPVVTTLDVTVDCRVTR
jgi:hypothetical protein